MDIDRSIMYQSLTSNPDWIEEGAEEHMMIEQPITWDGCKIPIFGEFRQDPITKFFSPYTNALFAS